MKPIWKPSILFFKGIIIFYILSQNNLVNAQETRKRYEDTSYWTFWNIDYELPNSDSLFFEINTRSSSFNDYIIEDLSMNRAHFMVGYAHKFKDPKLMIGASIRSVFEQNWNIWYWRAFFQHNGIIGDNLLEFQKRLSYEYITYNKTVDTPGSRDDVGRFGLWLMLGKNFNVSKAKLRGEFSYELFINQDNENENDRLVDLTRLRFDLYWLASERIRLGLFAMRNTVFVYRIASGPSFDGDGNLISEGVPEHNLNKITPTYGLTFKYSIRQKEECNCPGEKRRKKRR
ncbi:hypothetical protein [Flammeovirga sp. EKP202]|uniref:hypothetical protein n=1 Tax=Flammeovirga sp. EKP202 TaxID=2770592 RepID=UPI00165F566A|nr:hypothetical protein [Flammeovirga sp. EKP202]MBD0403961.1 hypothetical protein [Flammeovirga sp. EKP202]